MNVCPEIFTDVVTIDELALAAGVAVERVDELAARGALRVIGGRFVAWADAVEAGRLLRAEAPQVAWLERRLFDSPMSNRRTAALPAAVSSAAHAGVALAIVVLTSAGLATSAVPIEALADEPMRLVYLTQPGPGGGGGGGGLKMRARPPAARRAGSSVLSSPLPESPPPPPAAPREETPEQEPPVEKSPTVVAPVAERAADAADRSGVLEVSAGEHDSHGPGDGGGVGDGAGTGVGEGSGPGLGAGEGGGTGGGPYRPGSGIRPPRLLHEVKAAYTDEARRLGIRGDVVLEIVVRRDGTVGEVTLVAGLGHGLDRQAIDAVRQWRFSPATRLGSPVDVIVEVAVEFRLR